MPVTVTLAGPAPWGFRITGGRDFGKPITVSKVVEHGKAAAGDLRPGDVIVAINGESAAEMLNVEAQNKIKQSPGQLRLQVERSPLPPPSHANGDTSPERLATRFQVRPDLAAWGGGQGSGRARDSPDGSVLSPQLAALGGGVRLSWPLPGARKPEPPEQLPGSNPASTPPPALGQGSGPPQTPGRCSESGAALRPLPVTAWARSRPCGAWRRILRSTRCCRRTGSCGRPRGSPAPSVCCRRLWRTRAEHAGGADPGRPVPAPILLRLRRLRPQPEDEGPLLGGRRALLRETRPPPLPGPPGGAHHPLGVPPVL
ncbi:unnamed protein product, partial [Bubo scandiacus]